MAKTDWKARAKDLKRRLKAAVAEAGAAGAALGAQAVAGGENALTGARGGAEAAYASASGAAGAAASTVSDAASGAADTLATAVAALRKGGKVVSPLAPKDGFPDLPPVAGVEFAAAEAGVRYANRRDVMLIRLAPGTSVAGAFTRSSTRSACVRDCEAKVATSLANPAGAAILVNSGNSNAFTGKAGDRAVAAVTGGVAKALGLPAIRVFTSSTGVIGEPLDPQPILRALPGLAASLAPGAVAMAAEAMMTTDTFPKGAGVTIDGDGGPIHIAGIAKGSGMIAPDMATMLVYIFTDATVSPATLRKMLARNVDATFNSITVDSDTSTSDTLLLCATGRSPAARPTGEVAKAFEAGARPRDDVARPPSRARRRGGDEVRRGTRDRRREPAGRGPRGARHRRLAPRQDGHRGRGPRTGAASSPRSASPAPRRTATACRSAWATSSWPPGAFASAPTARRTVPPT